MRPPWNSGISLWFQLVLHENKCEHSNWQMTQELCATGQCASWSFREGIPQGVFSLWKSKREHTINSDFRESSQQEEFPFNIYHYLPHIHYTNIFRKPRSRPIWILNPMVVIWDKTGFLFRLMNENFFLLKKKIIIIFEERHKGERHIM